MDSELEGWYFVDAAGKLQGPFNVQQLQDLQASDQVTESTVMWRDRMTEWLPLGNLPELLAKLAPHEMPTGKSRKQPEALSANDPLALFKAEIAAVEAEVAVDPSVEAGQEGPATPEELSFEDDDGTMYIWDHGMRKYVPQKTDIEGEADGGDEAALALAQQYEVEDMTFAVEEEVIPTLAAVQAAAKAEEAAEELKAKTRWKELKRKVPEKAEKADKAEPVEGVEATPQEPSDAQPDAAQEAPVEDPEHPNYERPTKKGKKGSAKAAPPPPEPQAWVDLKVNTSVYITGVPEDATVEEVAAAFTKCGIIKVDEQGQPRVKLYRDRATGMPKGDGLVTYLKEPSVDLAVQLLDGAQLRPGQGPPMTVSRAKFEMKGGAYVPKPKSSKQDRKRKLEALEKMLSWGGYDDKLRPEQVTVVLHHMFRPEDFLEEEGLVEELEEDISGECSKLGPVEKVRVFKNRPDGVVTVKFRTEEGAKACVQKMDGRFFAGQQIEAHMWDGVTNYQVKVKESAEEEAARLEAFARQLEAGAMAAAQQPGTVELPDAAAVHPSDLVATDPSDVVATDPSDLELGQGPQAMCEDMPAQAADDDPVAEPAE